MTLRTDKEGLELFLSTKAECFPYTPLLILIKHSLVFSVAWYPIQLEKNGIIFTPSEQLCLSCNSCEVKLQGASYEDPESGFMTFPIYFYFLRVSKRLME